MRLLSDESSNAKLSKNAAKTAAWRTSILYLSPAEENGTGVSLCPAASAGCKASCLYRAGRGVMRPVYEARLAKTMRYLQDRDAFMADLSADLVRLVRRQARTGVRQAVRLNGTSDVRWENTPIVRNGVSFDGVPQAFPELKFYDYTKIIGRRVPTNYSLTFSASEINGAAARRVLMVGRMNVAVVFHGKTLPTMFWGRPVIDGTAHDMRFLDPAGGVVVGLLAKGPARRDRTGFVREATEFGPIMRAALSQAAENADYSGAS